MEKSLSWSEPGRENLELTVSIENGVINNVKMKAVGCLDFLKMSQSMKSKLQGPISDLVTPAGKDHASMIWREIILDLQEQWKFPVDHEELCHCRKITTQKVDRAIVYGAHSIEEVRHRTSANTGCGTCKNDVHLMIENRVKIS